MDKLLKIYNHPGLNQKEQKNLNGKITKEEIESVTRNLPSHKSPGPDGFTGEFWKTVRDELIWLLPKLFKKIEEEGIYPK